jgi:hypothetical protein
MDMFERVYSIKHVKKKSYERVMFLPLICKEALSLDVSKRVREKYGGDEKVSTVYL